MNQTLAIKACLEVWHMSFPPISLTKASCMALSTLKGNLEVYSFQVSRTRRNRLFLNSPNSHSQLLGVLLNFFSQSHFLVNNSVLCFNKNHPLGESPSKFVHTCLHVVFIFLFHGPWPSGCWPQREKCRVPVCKEFTVWDSKVTIVGLENHLLGTCKGQGHHRKTLEDSMGGWVLPQLADGVLPVLKPGEEGAAGFMGWSTQMDESV